MISPKINDDSIRTLLLWVYRLCLVGFVTSSMYAVYVLVTTGTQLLLTALVVVWYACALFYTRDHWRRAFGR